MPEEPPPGRSNARRTWHDRTKVPELIRRIPQGSVWMSTNVGHARSVYQVLRLTPGGVKVRNITPRGPHRLRDKTCVIPIAQFLLRHERVS